jgi:hypothetical protein
LQLRRLFSPPQVGENGQYTAVVLSGFPDPKLREGASDVSLDGLRAEPERPADALVRAAFSHQREDLPLTRCQTGDGIDPTASGQQLVDDRSVDDAFTRRNPLHGVEEVFDTSHTLFIR